MRRKYIEYSDKQLKTSLKDNEFHKSEIDGDLRNIDYKIETLKKKKPPLYKELEMIIKERRYLQRAIGFHRCKNCPAYLRQGEFMIYKAACKITGHFYLDKGSLFQIDCSQCRVKKKDIDTILIVNALEKAKQRAKAVK